MTESTRGARFFGRAALRTVTTVTRCWDCGRQPTTGDGHVGIRKTAAGVVGFSGIATCGRVWLCPVCNAKVMARRAVEIGAVLTWAAVQGYQVIWGSLTVWHHSGSRLADLIEMQQAAWRHVVQSRTWSKFSATKRVPHVHISACFEGEDFAADATCDRKYDTALVDGKDGRVGYIRASELTVGSNGWHPHFHPIILVRGSVERAEQFAYDVVTEWITGVTNQGGEAIREGGQQLKVVTGVEMYDELSGYVTKATYDHARLALEAVWSQSKGRRGRVQGTTSHWSLLAGIEAKSFSDTEDWHELEEATHGHRMITWSRGVRTFAGLNEEQSNDEDEAAKEVGTKEDTVAVITPAGWVGVRDNPAALAAILDTLEAGSRDDLADVLNEWGVEWTSLELLAESAGADDYQVVL